MEALLAAARHAYGIPRANGLAAAPGSQALFQMLPAMRPRSRVAVLAPTYEEHAVAWRRLGHAVDEVGSLEKCGDSDVAVVVNPNNPDGRTTGRGTLAGIAEALARRGGWLVVDETFADVAPDGCKPGIGGLLVSALIAQNSLYRHVADVAGALERDGVEAGRRLAAVAPFRDIVGRDPESLDGHGVARSAESLAENFGDGVVAPVLWGLILGLPGIVAYKALNTADSMIGHLDRRYREFGWAAARLDDVANWVPARVAGFLLAVSGIQRGAGRTRDALEVMWRDGGTHRSVNAGYPEASMAGALGLRLAGPRRYQGFVTDDPWLGHGSIEATAADIRRGLRVYVGACLLLAVLMAGLWAASRLLAGMPLP